MDVLYISARQAYEQSYNTLLSKGFKSETLLRLAGGKVHNIPALAAAISRPNAKIVRGEGFFDGFLGWRDAEKFLRSGSSRPGRFPPKKPPNIIRYPDAVIDGVSKEAKTGYVKNSKRIRTQIDKDAALVKSRHFENGAEWHFFLSGRSDSIGADPALLDLLDDKGIKYFFHIP